jgi:nitric oxide reductase subunit B
LLWLFILSAGAIGLFYGAGLTWGQHTNLSLVEYWRWWVVHLWVEGFFEVFATAVIAFFFARLKLIRPRIAARAAPFCPQSPISQVELSVQDTIFTSAVRQL